MKTFSPPDTTDSKELTLLVSDLQNQVSTIAGDLATLTNTVTNPGQPAPTPNVPQSVNQNLNGDFCFSWPSWNNAAPVLGNGKYECYNWYSFPASTSASNAMVTYNTYETSDQTLTFVSGDVSVADNWITITGHGLSTGQAVFFDGLAPPSPLTLSRLYYIIVVNANRVRVADTAAKAVANDPIILLSAGGGGDKTFTFNYTLKEPNDTYYSSAFSEWSWDFGTAHFQGANDVSTKLPGNNIDPGRSYYLGINAVKATQYVTCAADVRISAGLYGYSTGEAAWSWLHGNFTVTATVIGDVSHGTTSRDYVVQAVTSRGVTVQSSVCTVAGAPDDYSFAHGAVVLLQWKQVLNYGVLSYDIYRKTGATYEFLQSIVTGQLTALDNNSVISTVGGYPSATFTKLTAFTSTQSNVVHDLPYSGDPLSNQWATVVFALRVPQNFDKSDIDITKGLWLRLYLENTRSNGNLDLTVDDAEISNLDTTLTSAAAQFTADMVGLTVTVTANADSSQTLTTTIASYNSSTSVDLTASWPYPTIDSNLATAYIEGGAPAHSIWIDLVHLDYVEGAAFAPNAEDISPSRGAPSVLPTHTTQGGVGTGGINGDGRIVCLFEDEIVLTTEGRVRAGDLRAGMLLESGYGTYNRIKQPPSWGLADIWLIVTENGCSLMATKTKQIFISKNDKKSVQDIEIGDDIVTYVDDQLVWSKVIQKELVMKQRIVVQISLYPDEHFLAGQGKGYISVSNSKSDLGTLLPV